MNMLLLKGRSYAQHALTALTSVNVLTPGWAYVFRSAAAVALTYAVAYSLQLDRAYSAANSVMLVASASQGATLGKGASRLAGTIIGGIAAIVLLGLTIQAPALFLIGYGLWLGMCSAAATVSRHFRSTTFAVLGYTVGFAAYEVLENPAHAFNGVATRIATVAVGVVCLGVVSALFSRRATREKLESAIALQLGKVGRLILARTRNGGEPASQATPEQIAALFAIDDLLEVSRAESPEVAVRAVAVRDGLAALFGALLGATESSIRLDMEDHTQRAAAGQTVELLAQAIELVESGEESQLKEALKKVAQLRRRLNRMVDETESQGGSSTALIKLDRLIEVISDWEAALIGLVQLHSPRAHRTASFRFHRDWHSAIKNGIRALIFIPLVGELGLLTGWRNWQTAILLLAPYGILMAMTGNPVAGAVSFVKGTAAAIAPAFLCGFFLLPHVQGFPLMIAVMLPFWIAGFYAITKPNYAFAGMGYLVAFNTLIGEKNLMSYDMSAFFNYALGWMIAVIATVYVLKLILPHDPRRNAGRLSNAIRNDVRQLISSGYSGPRLVWEHLQHHRLAGIVANLKGDKDYASTLLSKCVGVLHLGRSSARLHLTLQDTEVPASVRQQASEALNEAGNPTQGTGKRLAVISEVVHASADTHQTNRRAIHRISACIRDMGGLVELHGDWFATNDRNSQC